MIADSSERLYPIGIEPELGGYLADLGLFAAAYEAVSLGYRFEEPEQRASLLSLQTRAEILG